MSDLGLGVIKKGKKKINTNKRKRMQHTQMYAVQPPNVNKASFRVLVHVRSLS